MKKKGFTLIELLVVIAIIALLLSIVMPALRKVKEKGKTIVCGSHIRSLTQVWVLYTEENNGKIINANASEIKADASASEGYQFKYANNPAWAGVWVGSYDRQALEAGLRIGVFYPYLETIEPYRCTNHGSYNKALKSSLASASPIYQYAEKRLRSYSIVDSMNGASSYGGTPYKKMSEIRNNSSKMVFIDRGQEGRAGWSIFPGKEQFYNPPGIQHNDGTVVSFADGHSEALRWEDERTIEYTKSVLFGEEPVITSGTDFAVGNPDFMKLLQATWGPSKLRGASN